MSKLFSIFSIISLSIVMNSCMGDGSEYFNYQSPCYVTRDNSTGLVYAKSLYDARFITSEKIKLMTPGTFSYMVYSWDESYGVVSINNGATLVYNNVIVSDDMDIPKAYLYSEVAPPQEEPVYINSSLSPNFMILREPTGSFMDDYWLLFYTYKIKEGETVFAQFYLPPSETEIPGEIIVDIRLTKNGEPSGTSEKLSGNYVAVDMSYIRDLYLNSSTKSVKIKFRYYLEGQSDLFTTNESYTLETPQQSQL